MCSNVVSYGYVRLCNDCVQHAWTHHNHTFDIACNFVAKVCIVYIPYKAFVPSYLHIYTGSMCSSMPVKV